MSQQLSLLSINPETAEISTSQTLAPKTSQAAGRKKVDLGAPKPSSASQDIENDKPSTETAEAKEESKATGESKATSETSETSVTKESKEAKENKVLSVEELNVFIRQLLEGQVGTVWVRGELSNFKAHTSGHFYFSIKDSKAQVNAVMFRGQNSKLKFRPSDGLEVLVRGRISVYEPRGTYQITCDLMEPVGAGALQKAFEQLKDKLKAEGLFEASRKRPLPPFPRHIAVVTSPTGAAVRDILNILNRRARAIQVTLVPTIVQGEGSADQIRLALQRAQQIPDVDVIIIGRGGGSMEDLWGFNDEKLAREIAGARVPVISAVGHEIDFTIADFVADLRAPTPSAAAELVAKSSLELQQKIENVYRLLKISIEKQLKFAIHRVQILGRSLVDPQKRLQDYAQRNDDLSMRLEHGMNVYFRDRMARLLLLRQKLVSPKRVIDQKEARLNLLVTKFQSALARRLEFKKNQVQKMNAQLDSMSPLRVVERGYSIVTRAQTPSQLNDQGQHGLLVESREVIKSSQQVIVGDRINVRLALGSFEATVISTELSAAHEVSAEKS